MSMAAKASSSTLCIPNFNGHKGQFKSYMYKNESMISICSDMSLCLYVCSFQRGEILKIYDFPDILNDFDFHSKSESLISVTQKGWIFVEEVVLKKKKNRKSKVSDVFDDLLKDSKPPNSKQDSPFKITVNYKKGLRFMKNVFKVNIISDFVVFLQHNECGIQVLVYNISQFLHVFYGGDNVKEGQFTVLYQCVIPSAINSKGINPSHIQMLWVLSEEWSAEKDNGVIMKKELFKVLFGEETHLLKSPVILFAIPSGQLYAVPIKATSSGKQYQLLYDLQELPVGIHAANVIQKPIDGTMLAADCVVLVSVYGKVSLIQYKENCVNFEKSKIPAPVRCSTLKGKKLIHSTKTNLYLIDIGNITPDVSPQILDFYDVCALEGRIANEWESGVEILKVSAMSSRGRFYSLSINPQNTLPSAKAQATASQHQIQTVLGKLDTVAKMTTKTEKYCALQRDVLKSLSIGSSILGHKHSKHFAENYVSCSECVISCNVEARSEYTGINCLCQLEVKLINQSVFEFTGFWKVLVVAKSLQPSSDYLTSKASHLSLGEKNSFQILTVPLQKQAIQNLPLCVTVSLVLDVNSASDQEKSTENTCCNDMLSINMFSRTFDILEFVQTIDSLSKEPNLTKPETFQNFIESLHPKMPTDMKISQNQVENLKGSIPISRHILQNVQARGFGEEVDILCCILKKSFSQIKEPYVKVFTPDGVCVTLYIQSVLKEHFELGFQCRDLGTFLVTRQALQKKVQMIIDHAGHPISEISTGSLSQYMISLKELKQEAEEMQEKIESNIPNRMELMKLHEKMRKLVLPC